MEKRYIIVKILIIIGIISPLNLYSKIISLSEALNIASNFYLSNPQTRSQTLNIKLFWDSNELSIETKSHSIEAPTFYVFKPDTDKGFIIVAGDDIINPILGYSFSEASSTSSELPIGLKLWLEDIDNHINSEREKGYPENTYTKSNFVTTRAGTEIKNLGTAKWNQTEPFNLQCPMDGNKQSITGCVATAIGTIMYYHKWPDSGIGTSTAYTTETKGINVPSRDLSKPYDWEQMLPEYKKGTYNEIQANSVARLLADVGAVYQADYTSESTGAYTNITGLYKYFKYDSGMSLIARKGFFKGQFDNYLKREINQNRPILYTGVKKEGVGHAFIIDGYDQNDYFHINWGWGGYSNGFYCITEHEYSLEQKAFINIKPATDEDNIPENWITVYNTGLESSIDNIDNYKTNEYFKIQAITNNRAAIDFKGYIRLAIVDKQLKLKEWISDERSYELDGRANENGKYYKSIILNAKISKDIQIGDRIRLYYRTENTEWDVVYPDPYDNWDNVNWEIPVADLYYIRESTSVKFDKTRKTLTITYKKGVVPTIMLGESTVTEGITSTETSVTLEGVKVQGEKYRIRLEKRKELEEFEFSAKSM